MSLIVNVYACKDRLKEIERSDDPSIKDTNNGFSLIFIAAKMEELNCEF